jgi:hypothetical protein
MSETIMFSTLFQEQQQEEKKTTDKSQTKSNAKQSKTNINTCSDDSHTAIQISSNI